MATVMSHRHMSTRARERRVPFVQVRRTVLGLSQAARLTHKWGTAFVYEHHRRGWLFITPWEREELTDSLLCVVGNLTAAEAIELLREECLSDTVN